MQDKKAFSLIELLLVVALISVLAGLSLPRFRQTYGRMRLQQAAEELSFLMRYAQGRAVARQQELQIQFDSDNRKYRLMEKKEDVFVSIDGRRGRVYSIPQEISVDVEQQALSFFPNGQMDKVRIFLSDETGKSFVVSTKEMRGRVQVFEPGI